MVVFTSRVSVFEVLALGKEATDGLVSELIIDDLQKAMVPES